MTNRFGNEVASLERLGNDESKVQPARLDPRTDPLHKVLQFGVDSLVE
jgi:hypothetical protein